MLKYNENPGMASTHPHDNRMKELEPYHEVRLTEAQRRKLRRQYQKGADYMHADELEFALAMERYKREQRRPFPQWSEVLDVIKSLGYSKAGSDAPPTVLTVLRDDAA